MQHTTAPEGDPYRLPDTSPIVLGQDAPYQQIFDDLSHALQSPLSSLRTALWLCRDQVLDEKTYADLEQSVLRMSHTTRSMLSYARTGYTDPPMERVCLYSIASRVCQCLMTKARAADIALTHDGSPGAWVLGNEHLLFELLENLLTNSLTYTAGCQTREITCRVWQDDTHVTIRIADTGIGIPPDELTRVWERLYRARNARTREGTGFGLAIVARIAAVHQATISLESTLAVGTTVQVSLPRAT